MPTKKPTIKSLKSKKIPSTTSNKQKKRAPIKKTVNKVITKSSVKQKSISKVNPKLKLPKLSPQKDTKEKITKVEKKSKGKKTTQSRNSDSKDQNPKVSEITRYGTKFIVDVLDFTSKNNIPLNITQLQNLKLLGKAINKNYAEKVNLSNPTLVDDLIMDFEKTVTLAGKCLTGAVLDDRNFYVFKNNLPESTNHFIRWVFLPALEALNKEYAPNNIDFMNLKEIMIEYLEPRPFIEGPVVPEVVPEGLESAPDYDLKHHFFVNPGFVFAEFFKQTLYKLCFE